MILLIDNYDSFSYNLYQLLGTLGEHIKVIKNEELSVADIGALAPTHIILSPGPGYPSQAGICMKVVVQLGKQIPILGVCLGHQAIGEAFGAEIAPAPQLMHGKQSLIKVDTTSPLFRGLEEQLLVGRYHSLVATKESIPDCLSVIAHTPEGDVMAVKHKEAPIYEIGRASGRERVYVLV